MADIAITAALTSGGSPILLPKMFGEVSPGNISDVMDIYIYHNSSSKLTGCKVFIQPTTLSVYPGTVSAVDDYETILQMGTDGYPSITGSGLYINMNCSEGFPAASWIPFRYGEGDLLTTAIIIPSTAISLLTGEDGEIPAHGEIHIQLRFDVPVAWDIALTPYFDFQMTRD